MQIIPVINCTTLSCFRSRVARAAKFVAKKSWVHVDIGKKPFTPKNSVVCLRTLKKFSKTIRFEAHYMAPWNRRSFLAYLRMPFERIYVHASKVSGDELLWACNQARKQKKELGLVYVSGESAYKKHPNFVRQALVLAVHPGNPGQRFHPSALKTISFLKKKYPRVTIIVDGGICPISLHEVLRAGAHGAVSGSFLWGHTDPAAAYSDLRNYKL